MKSISRTLSTLTIAGLVSFVGTSASAQRLDDTVMMQLPALTIDVSDFDLSSSEDIEALYHRIRRAARRVCIDQFDGWSNKGWAFKRVSCIGDAVDQAVASANLPGLIELHGGTLAGYRVASR